MFTGAGLLFAIGIGISLSLVSGFPRRLKRGRSNIALTSQRRQHEDHPDQPADDECAHQWLSRSRGHAAAVRAASDARTQGAPGLAAQGRLRTRQRAV